LHQLRFKAALDYAVCAIGIAAQLCALFLKAFLPRNASMIG
jgi:hypothetical protein